MLVLTNTIVCNLFRMRPLRTLSAIRSAAISVRAPRGDPAALTLALNPIYFGLSCTFMTDVPFTVLLVLSILGLFLGLDTGRDRLLWMGFAAAFAALFVRQLALAVFLAFLVASPLRLGFVVAAGCSTR